MISFYHKFRNLQNKIQSDDIFPWASMLTIYLMLSLIPIVILVTDIATRTSLTDPEITSYLLHIMPGAVYETIIVIVENIEVNQSSSIIPTTIIIILWSSSRGMLAIIKALNKAYNVKEKRNYFHLRALALLYTVGFLVLIVVSLLLIVFGNNIYNFIDSRILLPDFLDPLFSILRIVVTVVFSMIFFLFLYNLSPSKKIGVISVLPGTLLSTFGILASSGGFSLYVKYSRSLSYFNGSLAGFMILILWLFLISVIIMIGGEVNAVFSIDYE